VFLFILESIGTSELILIGIIALIFLGPRKLPQIAKTIGKTMADFRNTTNEFKSTWEREVNFEEEAQALRSGDLPPVEPTPVPRETGIIDGTTHTIAMPEIKPVQPDMFSPTPSSNEPIEKTTEDQAPDISDKKNWL
jgi:Tat protein translocase TatB subunit